MAKLTKKGIDRGFIVNHLDRLGMTQREFSRRLGVDPSTLILMMSGRRRIRPDEAATMAEILGLDIDAVLKAAGVSLAGAANGGGPTVRVMGVARVVAATGRLLVGGQIEGVEWSGSVGGPFSGFKEVDAIGFETAGSVFDWMDGGMGFLLPKREGDAATIVGVEMNRLSLVKVVGRKDLEVAIVRRSWGKGGYALVSPDGGTVVERGVGIEWARGVGALFLA